MTATRIRTVIDSPLGPLTLTAHDGTLSGLYFDGHRGAPVLNDIRTANGDRAFGAAIEQLNAYFGGDLTRFDLQLRMDGTPFQRTVWTALADIGYGTTETYGHLARRLGRPSAARAVGAANAANPISIILPCHRVIGTAGALTGYGGGLERKKSLLGLERSLAASGPSR